MDSYKNILRNIIEYGYKKAPTRKVFDSNGKVIGTEEVENKTTMLPNVFWNHNMRYGFPLLTLRKMAINSILVELEAFIKGITSKKWYQDRKCKIWDEWASPTSVQKLAQGKTDRESVKQIQLETDDLGPIYGSQGRNFNGEDCDQLRTLVETLKNTPNDRRMVVSYWNPNKLHEMALPPCHYAWNVTVSGEYLNLFWVQRSADFMLGVPFDIVHYAVMLLLLCEESGLKPGQLSAVFVDCHVYDNHLEQAREIIDRETLEPPEFKVTNFKSIFEWTYKDYELNNYKYHPAMKMEVTV